jgi:hypothetical protein
MVQRPTERPRIGSLGLAGIREIAGGYCEIAMTFRDDSR